MKISRRSLLLASGAGLASTLTLTRPVSAQAVAVEPAVGTLDATVFDKAWAHRHVVGFPSLIEFESDSTSRILTAKWDSRVYARIGPVLVGSGKTSLNGKPAIDSDGRLEITIPAEANYVIVPGRVRELYPQENLHRPLPLEVWLDNRLITPPSTNFESAPWGGELYVDWGESRGYAVARSVMLRSVGPNPIPAGTTIVVRYARTSAALNTQTEKFDDGDLKRQSAAGDKQQYEIQLDAEVPMGDMRTFDLGISANQALLVGATSVAEVSLAAPRGRLLDMRATRRVSVSPSDSSGVIARSGTRIEGA